MRHKAWLLPTMTAALIAGCSAPPSAPPAADAVKAKGETVRQDLGNWELTEYISTKSTPDADSDREQGLTHIAAPQVVDSVPLQSIADDRIEQGNVALAPFGFQVKRGSASLELYQGDSLLKSGFVWRAPSVAANGTHFVMAVGDIADETWLLRPTGLEQWDFMSAMWIPPVYAGDRLVAVSSSDREHVVVTVDGEEAYRTVVPGPVSSYPVKRLTAWEGKWVLELPDQIIIEGKRLPYDKSFKWGTVQGKPFYFVEHEGADRLVYDGEILPTTYEKIIRNGCCTAAAYNPGVSDHDVSFYAYKEKAWRLVVARPK